MKNIFNYNLENTQVEDFEILLSQNKTKIERIVSPKGCGLSIEWYDQNEDEWVVLLKGSAVIEFEDKDVQLEEGDTLFIKKHLKHRVKSTSSKCDTIWLAVFLS